jgi:hydroxyethylthiazole kinase-like uncharacterized protein yjeF
MLVRVPARRPLHPAEPRPDQVFVLTRQALREVDRLASAEFGIPSIVLMENAARHLADVAAAILDNSAGARVLIACGPGNNGGDGLALARHLHNAGDRVGVILAAPEDRYAGDARTNLDIARRMGIERVEAREGSAAAEFRRVVDRLGGADLVVDALLGTGLRGAAQGVFAELIREINASSPPVPVLAVDIPSGLDADSGIPAGPCVRATTTVSFVGLKEGFTRLEAQAYLGEIVVADIGAPRELTERLGRRVQVPPPEPPHRAAAGDAPMSAYTSSHRSGPGRGRPPWPSAWSCRASSSVNSTTTRSSNCGKSSPGGTDRPSRPPAALSPAPFPS